MVTTRLLPIERGAQLGEGEAQARLDRAERHIEASAIALCELSSKKASLSTATCSCRQAAIALCNRPGRLLGLEHLVGGGDIAGTKAGSFGSNSGRLSRRIGVDAQIAGNGEDPGRGGALAGS